MRLDKLVYEKGLVQSRERAKRLIEAGSISVNGTVITKPSYDADETAEIIISGEKCKYVGRGGLKLEKALKAFDIDVSGLICADIGASTGGFTDCLLQNGASFVYAVDVGHDQLDKNLVNDKRVANIEGINARFLSS